MNVKSILLGQSGVGKTRFLNHLRTFQDKVYRPTIGVDFTVYKHENKINLLLWDTSGSEKFRHVVDQFLKGMDLCIFIYKDVPSFEAMMELVSYVKSKSFGKRYCIISYGLPDMGKQVANKYGFFFFNVDVADEESCLRVLKQMCILCLHEQEKCNFLNLKQESQSQSDRRCSRGLCWYSFC